MGFEPGWTIKGEREGRLAAASAAALDGGGAPSLLSAKNYFFSPLQ